MASLSSPSIPTLHAERTGPNAYVVRNEGGAELQIGALGVEGSFSPVELLQAAVAGCIVLSAEPQLTHRLGEAFSATIAVDAVIDKEDNRISELISQLSVDMPELDAESADKLITSAERFIERLCTIKRSLNHGIEAGVQVGNH